MKIARPQNRAPQQTTIPETGHLSPRQRDSASAASAAIWPVTKPGSNTFTDREEVLSGA
jgi:hypothetical protein